MLWNALNSEGWRHREAAAKAFLMFMEAPKLDKYKDKDGANQYFRACMHVAKLACNDKLLQIYFIGLAILNQAMQPNICTKEIANRTISRETQPFIDILVEKVQELNY